MWMRCAALLSTWSRMRLVRSWPETVPPNRAHVVDDIEHFVMDDFDYSGLRDLKDDVLLLEWDMAVGIEHLTAFAERAVKTPDDVLVAPYILYDFYPWPVWAHRRALTEFVDEGEPECHAFSFGMVYLPQWMLAAFNYPRLDDCTFSTWHRLNVQKAVPIMWDVRPVHLHYSIPNL
jgi:hypothetical protein